MMVKSAILKGNMILNLNFKRNEINIDTYFKSMMMVIEVET